MRILFIEPHVRRYGGIRRVLELAAQLTSFGHEVIISTQSGDASEAAWHGSKPIVLSWEDALTRHMDVAIGNSEPQWDLLGAAQTEIRVLYVLHDATLYSKAGAWSMLRAPADLVLANSTWTAGRVEAARGERPFVLLGGINADHFHPVDAPIRYQALTVGDRREWKGTQEVRAAAKLAGLALEEYAGKDLKQSEMTDEYGAAEMFVVGSWFEGFGQPGLEALACGVPLVTTDNGGCRDYALHEETALVVPPQDVEAMADAMGRLHRDPALRRRLAQNGLAFVAEHFSWERSARRLETLLEDALNSPNPSANVLPVQTLEPPRVSVVIPVWNQPDLVQACIESVRRHTDVPYELILVDNGSEWRTKVLCEQTADILVANERNRGFSVGMNQGLSAASSPYIAFLNSDTLVPAGWASALLQTVADESVGIVAPAVTAANNPAAVREKPGARIHRTLRFDAPLPAICWVMDAEYTRGLGGFDEAYFPASGEDLDLAFKVWSDGRDIVLDERVLVWHESKGSSKSLPDRQAVWAENRKLFLQRWTDAHWVDMHVKGPDAHFGRSAATWMQRYFAARDTQPGAVDMITKVSAAFGEPNGGRQFLIRAGKGMLPLWALLRYFVPKSMRLRLYHSHKKLINKIFA